jgi:hypothetical protein
VPFHSQSATNSSSVISQLFGDAQLFKDLPNSPPPPAIAFFYFDFKDKTGQNVQIALRRIILQLSTQSPNPYKALDTWYTQCKGQTLPTYHDLINILKELLLELGRTYIVLDALDECEESDQDQLLKFISTLQDWTKTPIHLLITSQPRTTFTQNFHSVVCMTLEPHVIEKDIEVFVASELLKPSMKTWASHSKIVTERVVKKSSGMSVVVINCTTDTYWNSQVPPCYMSHC